MSPDLPATSIATLQHWFEIAPDAMIAVDQQGVIALANARALRIFGYAPDALHGLALETLVPESLRHAHRTHRQDYLERPRVRPMGIGYELMGVRCDGEHFPLEIGLSPVATESGVITIASVRDISETRRVRQAQERSRRDEYAASMSRLALESPDHELAIRRMLELLANALDLPAAAIASTSRHRSGLRIRASKGLSAEASQVLVSILDSAAITGGLQDAGECNVPASAAPQDGPLAAIRAELARTGFEDVAMVPLAAGHEPIGMLVVLANSPMAFDRDKLTFLRASANLLASAIQRSRTEERLAHAQRLDAVGQLTGGIAHDFNNLLTVISGNLQLLEAELSDRPPAQEIIESALRAVDRGSDLARRLLTFARRQPLQPREVVPQPLMQELATMLRRTLGETVLVEIECAVDVPDVCVDPNELDTALVNLALNARDAMPNGGRLGIEARAIDIEDADNKWKLPPGRYVAFSVVDTGSGMPPEAQAHVFEPFYTTKESGRGSGLGLSMVYGFVTQSGGGVAIDSRLGYGTCVELVLPAANADGRAGTGAPVAVETSAKRRANILVVEDENDVRTIAARFLSAVGYRVVTAAAASEALELLATHADVDLLFSDVVLGSGMDGVQLAHEARRIRPGLAVLLTSGYARSAFADQNGDAAADFRMLRKPYRREQLIDAVRSILDGT
ncbi:MAG: PAS domain S-box protein [Xanthomonadaceae bacterium]|nr:PAS domain S-box protein [Xanthomonadaceae bacterium]